MQERMAEALSSVGKLAAPDDVPSLDEVRDKIEQRYARALGRTEIASSGVEAKMLEVEKATIDAQGSERLEEIRKTLSIGPGGEAGTDA
jgi:phage shock protein A